MIEGGHKLIDHITNVLFVNEYRRLHKTTDALIDQNQEVHRVHLDGFTHAGEGFNREGLCGALQRQTLHISLWGKMDAFLADRAKVEKDKKDIQQLLFKLLEHAFQPQHLRDAIPDCIVDCLPDSIRQLQRCGNPESGLNHPRDFRQFAKTMPKIELYSAARLIY